MTRSRKGPDHRNPATTASPAPRHAIPPPPLEPMPSSSRDGDQGVVLFAAPTPEAYGTESRENMRLTRVSDPEAAASELAQVPAPRASTPTWNMIAGRLKRSKRCSKPPPAPRNDPTMRSFPPAPAAASDIADALSRLTDEVEELPPAPPAPTEGERERRVSHVRVRGVFRSAEAEEAAAVFRGRQGDR